VGSTRSVTVGLDPEETRALLQDVPGVYRTQVNDVLLAALGRVLGRWTGRGRVLVDLEGHGREDLFEGVDLSRTVGWFTTMFPVALEASEDAELGGLLKSVKEQLRAVPGRGLGYGGLRYLTQTSGLAEQAAAQVSFNYLGQFDWSAGGDDGLFRVMRGGLGGDASPGATRAHVLDVVGSVEHQCLEFTWSYSENRHHQSTISALAQDMLAALREIVQHCAEPGVGGATPSDFPLAGLDQPTVDRLVGDGRSVEDIYPLTPMQAGMVFHALAQGDQGVYFEQATFVLDGVDDAQVLGAAWQQVVDRTPVLRSRVVWDGVAEPLQVVQRQVSVPVSYLDWTQLSDSQRREELTRLLDRDRAQGLNLATAPLLRVAIAPLSDTTVQVAWSFHHVLLDGWSVFQVLSDVFACHAALAGGRRPELVARRPFRDYLHWLSEQDHAGAEEHWRRVLSGLDSPTPLPYDRAPTQAHTTRSAQCLSVDLDEGKSRRLDEFAKCHGLTPNTVVQGAWALVLSRYSAQRDVCFGATVSGRPADLPGAEQITGIFINTLPVRVDVDAAASVVGWLQKVQATQAEARRFDFVSLTHLQTWSDLPGGIGLFDSIVVFENYPINDEVAAAYGLRLRELHAIETTNYPLTVVVVPGQRLSIELGYDPALFDAATIERMAGHLQVLLAGIGEDAERAVCDLPMLSGAERHQVLVGWNDTEHVVPAGTVCDLFADQVRRAPDVTAVVSGEAELSYAELDTRANRLAHRLVRLGVGPECSVGLLMERSVELVVAVVAVVRAGGVYLPVDMRAPVDRMRLVLAEAGASVLITDRVWERSGRKAHGGELVVVDADLCGVHVGFDRGAEGCGGAAPGCGGVGLRSAFRRWWA
jgi:non-ribosomal peptide synthase protein (TIGR01720 family)